MEELPSLNSIVAARKKFTDKAQYLVPKESDLGAVIETLKTYDPGNQDPIHTGKILLNFQALILDAPREFREALKESGLLEYEFGINTENFELFKMALKQREYCDILEGLLNQSIGKSLMAVVEKSFWLFTDVSSQDLQDFVDKINTLSVFDVDGFYENFQGLLKDAAPDFLDKKYWEGQFDKLPKLNPKEFHAQLKGYIKNYDKHEENYQDDFARVVSLIISYPDYLADIFPLLANKHLIIEKIIALQPEFKAKIVRAKILDTIKDSEWKLYLKIITEEDFENLKNLLGELKKIEDPVLIEKVIGAGKYSPMMRQAIRAVQLFGDKENPTKLGENKSFVNKMLSRVEQDFEEEMDEIRASSDAAHKLQEKMQDRFFVQELQARGNFITQSELKTVYEEFRDQNQLVLSHPVTQKTALRYKNLSEQMTTVLQEAMRKDPQLKIGQNGFVVLDGHGKPYGTNGKIEIRFFEHNDNNSINLSDLEDRINFLGRAAKRCNDNKDEKIKANIDNQIDLLIQQYIDEARKKFKNIDTVQEQGKDFEAMATDVGVMYLELQKALVQKVFPKQASLSKALKELDEMGKQVVIDEGRPTIIHVRSDGTFNAQIPKGEKTYPTNFRGSPDPGVCPNSVLELAGKVDADKKVIIQTSFSRASSFSVLKLRKSKAVNKRQRLNYLNGLEDVKNLIRLMNLKDGEPVNIHWHTLFTPLVYEKVGGGVVGMLFPSEVRQARDQHRFIEMLNALGEIEVDGKKYPIEINHINTSVRDPKKLTGKPDPATQARINNRGMVKYIQRQIHAIKTAYPDLKGWLNKYCEIKIPQVIHDIEADLKKAYEKLYQALSIEDEAKINAQKAKEARAEIKLLEEKLMKQYEKVAEEIKNTWVNNPPKLPEKYQQNAHLAYFADVLNLYFSGRYMSEKGYPYLLVAEMQRTNDFADLITAVNCKSAKDRTKDAVDHTRMLLSYEGQNPGKFLLSSQSGTREYIRSNYQNIRRQGVGLAATGKNLPGAKGSRSNNPWGDDKYKTDSLVSSWGSLKASLKTIFRYWFSSKMDSLPNSERMLELLSETHDEDSRIYNIYQLRKLKNKTLAVAMIDLLSKKGLKISDDTKAIQKAVKEINQEILSEAIMPRDFLKKYNVFLKILDKYGINAINNMRGEFMVAVVTNNRNLNIKEFDATADYIEVKNEFNAVRKNCLHLEFALSKLSELMEDPRVEIEALTAELNRMNAAKETLEKLMTALNPNLKITREDRDSRPDLKFSVPLVRDSETLRSVSISKATAVIVYNPDQSKAVEERFSDKITDPEEIQKLEEAGEHLIELSKTQVSYTAPEGKEKLKGEELVVLIDKMLDEVLKKCIIPEDRINIKLSGENPEMVKLAKARLPERIKVLEEKELQEKLLKQVRGG